MKSFKKSYPYWQGQGENSHGDHVCRRFASDRFAASNGNICDKENHVGDNVHDETIVTPCNAVSKSIFIHYNSIAIKFLDWLDKDKHCDESNGDQELTQKCRVYFSDKLKLDKYVSKYTVPGNALARVQRVHEPADLWDINFCTRWFWGF